MKMFAQSHLMKPHAGDKLLVDGQGILLSGSLLSIGLKAPPEGKPLEEAFAYFNVDREYVSFGANSRILVIPREISRQFDHLYDPEYTAEMERQARANSIVSITVGGGRASNIPSPKMTVS